MVYLNADGTVTETKPFTVIGFLSGIITFFTDFISLFFDSILSTKKDVAAKRNRNPNGSNYVTRNYRDYSSQTAQLRRGKGGNVKGMSELAKENDAGPGCGGGS
ncbi:hypothetical protein TrRE_jg13592 [Triparma retinervis]|uniref:Uncharacterized protein n=1 Tax=Triparma retinervis TaxID=2557542 RepID=A0A9W7A3Q7_9STRA|nr:hypothetical protein TrRE_jg13592 [Triparma retinervis]